MSIDGKIAVRDRTLETLADRGLARQTARRQPLADGFGRLAARERPLHQETPARVAPVGHALDGPTQQPFGDSACRRLAQRFTYKSSRPLDVAVQRLAKQLFLAAEGGIEA